MVKRGLAAVATHKTLPLDRVSGLPPGAWKPRLIGRAPGDGAPDYGQGAAGGAQAGGHDGDAGNEAGLCRYQQDWQGVSQARGLWHQQCAGGTKWRPYGGCNIISQEEWGQGVQEE